MIQLKESSLQIYLLILLLGSLGPSTVTLMHLLYTATKVGTAAMMMWRLKLFPRPLRPMILKSLNLATLFFMTAVLLRSSPQKFSSFPALRVTTVPSVTSLSAITYPVDMNFQ